MGPSGDAGAFKSWGDLSAEHLALVRDTEVPAAGPPAKSAFTDERFVREMEKLTGAEFKEGSKITPLIDGPASFAERNALIDGAKDSIHMLTWAFYDDDTGWDTAARLVKKHDEGVDVKIIVDGNVARQPGHDAVLKHLEDHGVDVVRWNDPARPSDGQHRKSMVVDGKVAIAGGLNVGNYYSHMGPADGQKWRDTDVKVEGRAVRDASKLFARVFNDQVEAHGLPLDKVEVRTRPRSVGDGRTAVVDDTPGPDGNANILVATLKAIEGATKSVDIENAYFISTPALKDALLAALDRGVRVRVLTNSAESVDEPIVSAPILMSLPELAEAGAEIYLKQGDTLHSKFLIVDDMFSSVGSYNLHPRSERYEGEVAFNAIDEEAAAALTRAFEADIAAAAHPQTAADIDVPQTAFSMLAARFFFDQL
jgi:cardiolipin synthase